jgi:hypothetical protein
MDALEGMPKAQKDSCLQFFFGELDRYTKNGSVVVVGDPTWGNNVALNKNKNENRKIADDIKEMIGEPFNAIVDIFFDWTKSLQSLKRDVGEALTYAKENGLPSNTINELETAWNRLNSNSEAEQQKGRDMIKDLAVSSKKNGLYRMLAGKRGIKVNEYTPNGRVSMRINSGSVTNTQFGLDPREQYKPNLKSTAYFNVSISGALATLNLETYITTLFKAANPNADVKVKRETKGFYSVTVSQQPLRPKDSNQIGAEAQIIYFPSPNGPAPAMILLPIKFTPDKPQENKAGNVAEAGMEMTQRITMAPNAITEPSILVFGDPDEIGKRKVVDVYYPAGGPSSRPRPRWDEWHFDDFIRGKLPSERSNTAQTRNDMSSIKISTSNYAQGGIPLTNGAAMTPKATEDISKLAVETTALNESVPWYGLFGRIAPGRAPSGAEINNSIFAAAAKITKPDGMSDLEYIPLVAKEAAQQTQKMQRTFSSGGPLDNLFGSYLNYRVSTTLPGVDSYTKGVFASEFAGKLAHNVLTGGDPINTRMLMSTIQNGMQHFLDSNQVNMKIDQVQITDHVFIGGTIGLNPQGTMFGGQYNIQGATTAFLEFTYYYQKPLILGKYPLAMDFKFNLKAAMIGLPEGTILQGWYGAGDETYKVAGTLKSGKTIFAPLPDITLGLTYYATKTEQEKVSLSAGLRFIAPPATVSLFMPNKEAFFKQAPEFRRWSPGADLYLDAVVRESEDIYGKLSLGLTGLPEGIRFSYLSLDVKGQTPSSIYTLPIGVEGRIGGYLNAKEEMPYYSNAGGLIFSANLGVNLIHTVKVEGIPPFDIIIYGGYNSSATSVPNVGIGSLNYGLTVQMKSPLGLMVNSSP